MTKIGALKKITFYFVLLSGLYFWTNLTSGIIYPRIVRLGIVKLKVVGSDLGIYLNLE